MSKKPMAIFLTIVLIGIIVIFSIVYVFNKHLNPIPGSRDLGVSGGGPHLPTKEQAEYYIIHDHLLKQIKNSAITAIHFIAVETGGPGFMMVEGFDDNGNEKAYWLDIDDSNNIRIVNSTGLKDGLSKEQVFSIFKSKGINKEDVVNLFIAPTDLKNPPKWRIAWFAEYNQNGTPNTVVLDFKTGKVLSDNPF